MTAIVVNSADSLKRAMATIEEAWGKHRFLRLNMKTGKDRTLDFNALSHVWYGQLERELPEDDASGWKCFCKLNFGVPIMRAEDEEFRNFYDAAIKQSFSYEEKLAAMKYLPVTSLMTNPQMKKYCTAMQEHFATRGVLLEFPPEDR